MHLKTTITICILGMCALLNSTVKPACLIDFKNQILTDFVHLFTGLKKAIILRDEDNDEDDEEEAEIDDEDDLEELEDDDDIVDSDAQG
jgi:hypothetical protein